MVKNLKGPQDKVKNVVYNPGVETIWQNVAFSKQMGPNHDLVTKTKTNEKNQTYSASNETATRYCFYVSTSDLHLPKDVVTNKGTNFTKIYYYCVMRNKKITDFLNEC